MARFLACAGSYASNVLDTADIVRDACLQYLARFQIVRRRIQLEARLGSLLCSTDPPQTDTDDESDYSFQSADPSHFKSTGPP